MPKGSEFNPATEVMVTDEFILIRGDQNFRASLLQMLSNQRMNTPTFGGPVNIVESVPGAADQALIVAGINLLEQMALHAPKSNPVFEIAVTTPVLKIGTAEESVEVTATATEINKLTGVTDPIQATLASKAPSNSPVFTTTAVVRTAANGLFRVETELNGTVLFEVSAPQGAVLAKRLVLIDSAEPPTEPGYIGEIRVDFDYVYVYNFGGWKRTPLSALTATQLQAMGVTATAAELNILDGVAATAAELNKLAGTPAGLTAAQIGTLLGVSTAQTVQTQLDGKVSNTNPVFTGMISAAASDINGNAEMLFSSTDFYVEVFNPGDAGTQYYQLIGNDGATIKANRVYLHTLGGTNSIELIKTGEVIIKSGKAAPTSATDLGVAGEVRFDTNYMYRCTDTNTWKRTPMTSW